MVRRKIMKKKLIQVWVCADNFDDITNNCVVYPSSKTPHLLKNMWHGPGPLKDVTRAHFIRTYGAKNTPPKGEKWLMDIEL